MSRTVEGQPGEVVLRPGDRADLPAVQALAHRVWRAHYPGIITAAQIDYMLARGYALDALQRFVDRPDAGLELADRHGSLIGFAAWFAPAEDELKLDRLYVAPEEQRLGIGSRLLAIVAHRARALGARSVILNVNKHNVTAQAAYRKHGFTVREAVVVDIGGGFVMDDYVMTLPL